MNDEILKELLQEIESIPPLPDIIIKVSNLTRDPECTADQLTRVLSTDQALTANLLKLCNSPYYGIPRTISSVKQAIMYLGFHTVRNLVLTSTLYDVFQRQVAGYGFTRDGLWEHSVATAICAQLLGKRLRPGLADTAFTAGLLHDVGILVLARKMGGEFPRIKNLMEEEGLRLVDAERRVFGYDHTIIGAKIADKWNFPQELIQAIGNHHDPENAKGKSFLAVLTHVANGVASIRGYGLEGGENRDPISDYALTATGLRESDLTDIGEKLNNSMVQAGSFLAI